MDDAWHRIWEERGADYPDDDPALIVGYDQPYSTLSDEAVAYLVEDVSRKLALGPADRRLDVGCGAGLLLDRLSGLVSEAWGTDFAASLVQRAKKIFPALNVRHAEAISLPFGDGAFDKVLIIGVVQYFPDEDYVRGVIDELLRVCARPGRVLFGDVPDSATREESETTRSQLATTSEPRWRSSVTDPVTHLYLSRDFFHAQARERGIRCQTFDRNVPGYENARFRFDALFEL